MVVSSFSWFIYRCLWAYGSLENVLKLVVVDFSINCLSDYGVSDYGVSDYGVSDYGDWLTSP